jgi:hypothetical protein
MKKYLTTLLLIAGIAPSVALASVAKTIPHIKKKTRHDGAVIATKPTNKSNGVVVFSLTINPVTVVAD